MKQGKKILLFLIIALSIPSLHGQTHQLDSLLKLLPQKKGNARIDLLNRISSSYREISMPEDARKYASQSHKEATQANYNEGLAYAHTNLGGVEESLGHYAKALSHYKKALELHTQRNDRDAIVDMLEQVATVYSLTNDNQEGLKYAFKALKIAEKYKMNNTLGNTYNTVAGLYSNLEKDTIALRYYYKALHYDSITKDPFGLLVRYNNIGTIYEESSRYDSAYIFYNYALAISEKAGYQLGVSVIKSNIGNIYKYRKNYPEAIRLEEEALKTGEEINCELCEATAILNLGAIYLEMGEYRKAISMFEKSTSMHRKIGAKAELYSGYKNLSDSYEKLNDFKRSLDYHRKYVALKDSVLSEENHKALAQLQTLHQVEKQEQLIKDLAKAKELDKLKLKQNDLEIARNNAYLWLMSAGLLLLLSVSFISYRGYRRKKEANLIITHQKNEVEKQKNQIEAHKKEITDSILYAKRIQTALLPQIDYFKKIFPESLLLFKPKDIVSGDFFWISQNEEYIFYATVDCTGHGVPGGFMSMLGVSLLNEIVNEKKVTEPSAILNEMRNRVIDSLKQTGNEGENQDGMDMVFCRLNKKTKVLTYAAANNPLWVISKGILTEYKPDKQPVGIYLMGQKPFSQHDIQLIKDDMIYTFSDGFADQFGGPKGKKFRYKQMEELTLSVINETLPVQQQKFENALEQWQGEYEQIDDILVIGIKV